MSVFDFGLIAIATWYIQHLISIESGPWDVFDWVRLHIFGVEVVGDGYGGWKPTIRRPGILADLITCIYCRSFWVFLAMVGLWFAWHLAVLPFAGAGTVVLIDKAVKRGAG